MIKIGCQIKADSKDFSFALPENYSEFDSEIKTIAETVNRALQAYFISKGKIPESTMITIKNENGNVNITVS